MRKTITFLLALVLLLSLGLMGCGDNTQSNQPANNAAQPANSSAPADTPDNTDGTGEFEYELIDVSHFDREWDIDSAALGTYQLDMTTHDPATSMKARFQVEWANLIREATNGGVDITLYTGATLAGPGEALTAVEMGTADLAWTIGSSFSAQLPITNMFYLACLGLDENTKATQVMWDMYEESEQFRNEFSNVKLLQMYNTGITPLSTSVPVTTLDDLAGLKIRALGGTGVDLLSRMGASPITMGPGDMYDSLSKNVIDGYTIEWSGVKTFNLQEVTNYYGTDSLWTVPMLVIMNNDTFNELPAEYQEVIEYYSGREMSMQQAYLWEVDNAEVLAESAGEDQLCHFTDEDWAKIKAIADEYNSERAQELSVNGFDAVAFLERINEKVAEYEDYEYYRFAE